MQLPAVSVLLSPSGAACLFQLHVLATCAKPCESQQRHMHGLRCMLISHALHCTVQFEWLHCVGRCVFAVKVCSSCGTSAPRVRTTFCMTAIDKICKRVTLVEQDTVARLRHILSPKNSAFAVLVAACMRSYLCTSQGSGTSLEPSYDTLNNFLNVSFIHLVFSLL